MEYKSSIQICLGSSCFSRGNAKTLEVIKNYLKKDKSFDLVEFKGKLCAEACIDGPIIFIDDIKYKGVSEHNIIDILDKHLKNNKATV